MIRKVKATDYLRLMEIWESAVSSTHDFLKEEDFLYYKEQLPVYFQHVTLFGFEQEGILIGFMGIAEGNLEMLFVDDNYRGTGIGKRLITYAIGNLQVTKVDVNEQNIQAVGFYKYMGFSIYKRSNLDGEGKEYPILHMQL
ncbi:GNAT family N-acetyltransferase [Parabacteroides goldsteinii]|uniref:GNAT family N-acetyltransferase n=1 Tax=Parabacteroides goldsteinii TaxID=328812 RepID=UPI0026738922|nr:GNAT family N-acetyltransferase [Parabacteroides goldsteinii]